MNQLTMILQLALTLLVMAQNPSATIEQKQIAQQTAIQAISQANNEITRLKAEQKPIGVVYNTSNPYPVQKEEPIPTPIDKKLTIEVDSCGGSVTLCAIRIRYTEDGKLKDIPLKLYSEKTWGQFYPNPMPENERPIGKDGVFYWYKPQSKLPRTLFVEAGGLLATTTCQGSN